MARRQNSTTAEEVARFQRLFANGWTPLHGQVVDKLYNGTNGHVYNLSTACPLQICHQRTKKRQSSTS